MRLSVRNQESFAERECGPRGALRPVQTLPPPSACPAHPGPDGSPPLAREARTSVRHRCNPSLRAHSSRARRERCWKRAGFVRHNGQSGNVAGRCFSASPPIAIIDGPDGKPAVVAALLVARPGKSRIDGREHRTFRFPGRKRAETCPTSLQNHPLWRPRRPIRRP